MQSVFLSTFDESEEVPVAVKLSPKAISDQDLLWFPATDYGNALCVNALFGASFAYVDNWGLLYYNGVHWKREGDKKSVLRDSVVQMMGLRAKVAYTTSQDDPDEKRKKDLQKAVGTSNGKINAVIESFTALTDVQRDIAFFNRCKHLLNVQNGVVNLKTGELLPHSPDYGFTWVCPIDYNPEASTEQWVQYLLQTVQSYPQVKNYLQMAVGYTLTGETKEEKLFYLFGPTRSGKSTFLEVLGKMLGQGIAKSTSFTTFTKSRNGNDQGFDLAPLHAARFISASEGESQAKMNESVIKTITGNDEMSAAFKGKDYFNFRPNWKIWVASNYQPDGSVTDSAFWYRISLIVFPNSFAGKEDKGLKDSLVTKANLEGVLAWAVQGAVKWYQTKQGLCTPEVFQAALDKARHSKDQVQQWLDANCIVDKGNEKIYMTVKDVNEHFANWCLDSGIDGWKNNTVTRILDEKGFTVKNKKLQMVGLDGEKPTGKAVKCVFGIQLDTQLPVPWDSD